MAKDDMHVVIFKILAYIYKCIKDGEDVDPSIISSDALGINERYWAQIMREISGRGCVSGITVKETTTGPYVSMSKPGITLDGVEFLMENSMMAKAARFVADAGGFFGSIVSPFV